MQEHPNLRKTIIVFAILLVVAAALFLLDKYTGIFKGNIVENTFQETQEVKDPKNSFSLTLPKDWIINMGGGTGPSYGAFFAESPDLQTTSEGQAPDIKVTIKTGASLNALVRGDTKGMQRSNLSEIKSERIEVDGREALLVEYKSSTLKEGKILEAQVDNLGKRYYFTFGYNPATYPKGEAIFKAILETIKFIP